MWFKNILFLFRVWIEVGVVSILGLNAGLKYDGEEGYWQALYIVHHTGGGARIGEWLHPSM